MSRIKIGNVRDQLIANFTTETEGMGALDASCGKILNDLILVTLGQQANEYDSSMTYALSTYCIYENGLYKCTTAITTAEEWDATKWKKTTIAAELSELNSKTNGLLKKTSVTGIAVTCTAEATVLFDVLEHLSISSNYTVIACDIAIGNSGYTHIRVIPRGRTKFALVNTNNVDITLDISAYLVLVKTSELTDL